MMRMSNVWSAFWASAVLAAAVSTGTAQETENVVFFTNVNVWDGTSDGLQHGIQSSTAVDVR
jgi:hypothetical protein